MSKTTYVPRSPLKKGLWNHVTLALDPFLPTILIFQVALTCLPILPWSSSTIRVPDYLLGPT